MSARVTTLDDAWAALLAGEVDEATRTCVALLEADPGQVGAAALLARSVHLAGKPTPLALVDVFVRRGDLPNALSIAGFTPDPKAARRAIAAAFASDGRTDDVAPAPPPLPAGRITLDPDLARARGDALVARAQAALASAETDAEAGAPVPALPLFSALPAAALEPLLGAFEPRPLAAGEAAIHEGDEGKEAFVVVRGSLRVTRGETVLAELGPGAIFGEMSLVSDAPRAASVIALEPVLLLAASRADLEALAAKTRAIGEQLSSFCRRRMLSNLMRHSAILGAVSPPDRRALVERFETRRFKRGEALVTLGEKTEGLFLIASGAVRVQGRDADGETLELATLGPGDVVGEISLVLRRPATADVVATHQTVALELKHEQFQSAIRQHPELLSELYELATKREEETRTVVAQETLDVEDVVLL